MSGWGLLSDMRCTTDSGPSRHKRCPLFLWILKKSIKKSNLAGATSPSNGRDWSTRAKTLFRTRRNKTKTNYLWAFLSLGCSHTFTPSHSDEECRLLREHLAKDKEEGGKVPGEGYAGVKVLSEEEEELATCYEEMPGKYGW